MLPKVEQQNEHVEDQESALVHQHRRHVEAETEHIAEAEHSYQFADVHQNERRHLNFGAVEEESVSQGREKGEDAVDRHLQDHASLRVLADAQNILAFGLGVKGEDNGVHEERVKERQKEHRFSHQQTQSVQGLEGREGIELHR